MSESRFSPFIMPPFSLLGLRLPSRAFLFFYLASKLVVSFFDQRLLYNTFSSGYKSSPKYRTDGGHGPDLGNAHSMGVS